MSLGLVVWRVVKLLLIAFVWAVLSLFIINFLTNGNMFRRTDIALYTVLSMFSYLGGISLAIFAHRLTRQYSNRFFALMLSIVVFGVTFFSIQTVSAEIYEAYVETHDGTININYQEMFPRTDYP